MEYVVIFILLIFLASGGCLPHAGGGRASPWATASGWPQIVNPSQVCPQSLPSASHLAIPKHWLGSGSPSKHLCTYCPKATQQSPAARPAVAWLRCCSKVGATQHQELLTKGFHVNPQSIARRSPRRKRVWDDCFTSSSSISRSTECLRCQGALTGELVSTCRTTKLTTK